MNELCKKNRDVLKNIINVVFSFIGLITILFFAFVFFNLAQLVVSQFQIFEPNTYILKINGSSTTQLNPFDAATAIFSGLGIIGVLLTLWMQNQQLNHAKISNEKNEIEIRFFQLIGLLNNIVSDFDIIKNKDKKVISKGRDIFRYYLEKWEQIAINNPNIFKSNNNNSFKEFNAAYELLIMEPIKSDNSETIGYGANELLHFFRMVYVIVRFVDSISDEDKQWYIRILRAQLSEHQLKMLALNCISNYAKQGKDFKARKLYVKYALFQNIHDQSFVNQLSDKFIDAAAFKQPIQIK